ncbi:MAG TPA: tRNA-dihydrouridine synthase [Nitrospira sp.]|nr:tRNA-dihydrouridine synthase [Nitrospira sp.]
MNFWKHLSRPILGLSPMDGVTDAAFRRIVASQGKPDVMFTEFTHVHDVCRGPEFLLESLVYSEIERPIVAQLYGKDPALFYQAAHAVCELGFDGLDINMGCPSRNVAASGSGAGLIKTPDLAIEIIRAARQGIEDWAGGQTLEGAGIKPARAEVIRRLQHQPRISGTPVRAVIPLSVKTRLGYDTIIVERWIEHLLRERPSAISLHGRTLQQMYRGDADWAAIARAAEAVGGSGTLLLGNGDVQSVPDAVRRIEETGVDGVLIGRATLGAPWLFRDKDAVRGGGRRWSSSDSMSDTPSLASRFAILMEHARYFEQRFGVCQFRRMRKHLGWYCKGFPYASALRAAMFRVSSAADVEAILADFRTPDLVDVPQNGPCSASETSEDLAPLASRCG